MAELIIPTIPDARTFMKGLGYPIEGEEIVQTFRGYFPERRVLRLAGEEEDLVLKARPDGLEAEQERENLDVLFFSYRYQGGRFPMVQTTHLQESEYVVFKMSYLGPNLQELGQELDSVELGYIEGDEGHFEGFSGERIGRLVNQLEHSHVNFAKQHELIHGDVIQRGSPNNVVYNPQLDQLFLVDAEALAPATEERQCRFREHVRNLEEWMCMNLLKSDKS